MGRDSGPLGPESEPSGLLSALFPDQKCHRESAALLEAWDGRLLLSPFILAELDHLILKWGGIDAELTLLQEVATRVYELVDFSSTDVQEAVGVMEEFRNLKLGVADASIVVLSRRYSVRNLFSLDERHFRVVPGAGGRPFRLLPSDC